MTNTEQMRTRAAELEAQAEALRQNVQEREGQRHAIDTQARRAFWEDRRAKGVDRFGGQHEEAFTQAVRDADGAAALTAWIQWRVAHEEGRVAAGQRQAVLREQSASGLSGIPYSLGLDLGADLAKAVDQARSAAASQHRGKLLAAEEKAVAKALADAGLTEDTED